MISAVILTHNDERTIRDCLESVAWVDEVLIIDDHSLDETLPIITEIKEQKTLPLHVTSRSLNADFSAQRNVGLEQAKGEWVLFVDADEVISPALRKEIQQRLSQAGDVSGFAFRRIDYFLRRWLHHGEIGQVRLVRLGKKGVGSWRGNVHETWEISGKIETMTHPLHHYPHPTVSEFLNSVNMYSSAVVEKKKKEGLKGIEKIHWFCVVSYPVGKFIQNYILRRGFLDGVPGLIVAMMMSFHSFLVRAKLWQKQS